jgi:hypothetical protein
MGMDDVIEPIGVCAFFEGYPNCSSLALEKIDDGRRLGLKNCFAYQFPPDDLLWQKRMLPDARQYQYI